MNFRDEPPKRYSLNDDSDTDSEEDIVNETFGKTKVKKKIETYEIKCINVFPSDLSDVVIARELFLDILKQLPGKNEYQVLFQLTEKLSAKFLFNDKCSLYSIILPNNIPAEMCYQVSCYIFDHLKFKRILILATVFQWSVSSPVSFLHTTSLSLSSENKDFPPLRPPALLSGIEASILSLCEQRNLDAIAIIASSHGPSAHLQITTEVAEQVANIFDQLIANGELNLKMRLRDYNVNVKKRNNVLTMYL